MGLSAAQRQATYRQRKYAKLDLLPKVPCACGCGVMIAPITRLGRPARFAHGHNPSETTFKRNHKTWNKGTRGPSGPNHPRWNGGEWKAHGYVRCTISKEDAALYPTALKHGNGYSIMRSHLIWNRAYPDRIVQPGEHIHHINRVRDDDRVENFEKMDGRAHISMHVRERARHAHGQLI